MRNITAEAGCSTTGVYTYFGGKHGVVEAIFVEGFDSFDRAVADGFAARRPRSAAGRAYRRWALAHPTQYMVMFGRAVPDYEPTPEAHARSLESFFRLVAVVDSLRPGADAAERAYHYWATLHGYVMLELAGMGRTDARGVGRPVRARPLPAHLTGRAVGQPAQWARCCTKQSEPGKNRVV